MSEADLPVEPPEERLADRLQAQRPIPRGEFRGALHRRLIARDPGFGPRPEHLRGAVAVYLAAGGLLAGIGALLSIGVL